MQVVRPLNMDSAGQRSTATVLLSGSLLAILVLAVPGAGWDRGVGPASMSESLVLPGGFWLLVPVGERSKTRRQQQSLREHLDLTLQQVRVREFVVRP